MEIKKGSDSVKLSNDWKAILCIACIVRLRFERNMSKFKENIIKQKFCIDHVDVNTK